jgi:methylated-DNA-[protein]-cysteine S-methyltransferase
MVTIIAGDLQVTHRKGVSDKSLRRNLHRSCHTVSMLEWSDVEIDTGLSVRISATETAIRSIEFAPYGHPQGERNDRCTAIEEARRQLRDYFAGTRRQFDLPLDPQGTAFQKRVWQYLVTIPFGVTRSYRQVAEAIGSPAAVRAVGAANGANPIPIVVPCHRVIGANGRLTGYGGGLPLKQRLLELEGCTTLRLA